MNVKKSTRHNMLFFNILYTLIVILKNNEWQFVLFDSKKHTDEIKNKHPTLYICTQKTTQ